MSRQRCQWKALHGLCVPIGTLSSPCLRGRWIAITTRLIDGVIADASPLAPSLPQSYPRKDLELSEWYEDPAGILMVGIKT